MPADAAVLKAYLDALRTSPRAKAGAWNAVADANDPALLKQGLDALPFSPAVKSDLWQIAAGEPVKPMNFERAPLQAEGPQGSATSRALSNFGAQINPVAMVKGLAQAAVGPGSIPGALAMGLRQQAQQAATAAREGNYSEAAGHGMASVLPGVGPAAAAIGEQGATGDLAGMLGGGAGLLTSVLGVPRVTAAASRAVTPTLESGARAFYQSALKPTKAVLKDVRASGGPDAARTTLIDTGLTAGIPVSPRGAAKVGNLIDSLNAEVRARLKGASDRGATVDPSMIDKAIQDVAADFSKQINAQPELSAIKTVRENFATNPHVAQAQYPSPMQAVTESTGLLDAAGQPLTRTRMVERPAQVAPGPVPLLDAQDFKTNTYQGLRGKYGVEKAGTIEAEKAGARALKQGIETQAPEVAGLNAQEGRLIPLEQAIADAMRRRGNYGLAGLTPVVAAGQALATGHALPFLAAVIDRMPGLISRGGIWINRGARVSGRLSRRGGGPVSGIAAGTAANNERRTIK